LPQQRERRIRKSAKRCAIATPPNQHESGTLCPCEGTKVPQAAEFAGSGTIAEVNQRQEPGIFTGFSQGCPGRRDTRWLEGFFV